MTLRDPDRPEMGWRCECATCVDVRGVRRMIALDAAGAVKRLARVADVQVQLRDWDGRRAVKPGERKHT